MEKSKITLAKIESTNDRYVDRITVFIKSVEKMLELEKDRKLRINHTVVPRMEEFLKLDRHIQTNSVGDRRYNIPFQHAQGYVADILITRGNLTMGDTEYDLDCNEDCTEMWLVPKDNEDEIYPQFGPQFEEATDGKFLIAEIKPCGVRYIDGPKIFHIAITKVLQMYDNGELDQLAGGIKGWEEEIREFAAMDPKSHFDGEEYDMEFMQACEAVQSWDFVYFIKNGVAYGLEYSDDDSEVHAVPDPEDF